MLNSLLIAATGMHAEQMQLDTIANNLVNMNTTGYKKSRVSFQTLMSEPLAAPTPAAQGIASGYQGMGVGGTGAIVDFSDGSLKQTHGELDFAIQGSGLFEVQLPDGTLAYTRNGAFHIDDERRLVNADGHPLAGTLQVPTDASQILVDAAGRVQARTADNAPLTDVGYLQLSRFANTSALRPIGDNLYVATELSGEPTYSNAGENGAGLISQGYLEASNVQMIEELTSMMTAQRAYEASSRVLQASDEILGIINSLRK